MYSRLINRFKQVHEFKKNRQGSAMLLLMTYLIVAFFIIFLAGSIVFSLAAEQTKIHTICTEALAKIKWEKTWTSIGSTNNREGEHYKKRMSLNLLNPPQITREDAYEIQKIVEDTFRSYGYIVRNITVTSQNDNKIVINGEVLLRTRNLLFGRGNEEHWQKFEISCRLSKNFESD